MKSSCVNPRGVSEYPQSGAADPELLGSSRSAAAAAAEKEKARKGAAATEEEELRKGAATAEKDEARKGPATVEAEARKRVAAGVEANHWEQGGAVQHPRHDWQTRVAALKSVACTAKVTPGAATAVGRDANFVGACDEEGRLRGRAQMLLAVGAGSSMPMDVSTCTWPSTQQLPTSFWSHPINSLTSLGTRARCIFIAGKRICPRGSRGEAEQVARRKHKAPHASEAHPPTDKSRCIGSLATTTTPSLPLNALYYHAILP